MGSVKHVKISVDSFGSFLGMDKGCIILRDKKGKTEKYPLFEAEIGEVILKSGNLVSTGVLSALGFWAIDVLVTTRNGYPIAMLKNLEDDANVETRICQYEALKNGKAQYLAKQFVIGKIEGQNKVLRKYGLEVIENVVKVVELLNYDDLKSLSRRLKGIEGKYAEHYFNNIFRLFPKEVRPRRRSGFKAYDGTNNIFNLAYEILSWKVHSALIKAKLEPYLGFLHSVQHGKPSLVCDFIELYRYLIDDFLIEYCRSLNPKDFIVKTENIGRKKKGKRKYLKNHLTHQFITSLETFLQTKVEIPRIKHGRCARAYPTFQLEKENYWFDMLQ
jgi:CRISPR-associated protein Cas1